MTARKKNKKVVVAMSGGVDSSVAAAILKDQGYDVAGVFMHFWKEQGSAGENKCCSLEDQEKARRVANILGIPFYVKNIEKEFKKEVVDYFLDELRKGKTPNPCVMCNKQIKFKKLLEMMMVMKFDHVATGHYARIAKRETRNPKRVDFGLFEAKDGNKDQSYFLYTLTQEQLSKILFPISGYTKSEVRKIAKKFNLPVHDKAESQDICFIPEKEPGEFIKRNLKIKKGKIVDSDNNILGEHGGLPLYTIGQRKSLAIGGKGPYFVTAKDMENNRLVVTNDIEDPALYKDKLEIRGVNWTREIPKKEFRAEVKIRYRKAAVDAIIKPRKDRCLIQFTSPQKAITSGQSAVIYSKKGEVLGGGTII